ncbi:hypothetical protein FHX42_003210 [Saccharopolyspora lacisalsi]|uniref:Uncharacterized protein n=1 Tax=Halosaccharopolyspora lacisalsi TaxID=1000566 RepID=A0A839DWG2_9PSEU|nr:hypothetical protein [Halosaccharopolyspora lacisalsi]
MSGTTGDCDSGRVGVASEAWAMTSNQPVGEPPERWWAESSSASQP